MAGDPGYRLESPALGVPRRDNQALVECVMVCGCRWANVVENEHFQALGQMGTKKAKMIVWSLQPRGGHSFEWAKPNPKP